MANTRASSGYNFPTIQRTQAEILAEGMRDRAHAHAQAVEANGGKQLVSAQQNRTSLTPIDVWGHRNDPSGDMAMLNGTANPAASSSPPGVLNPYDWRGHEGIAHPPAINNPTGHAVALPATAPQTAPDYKGESTYFDPYAGSQVHEINPALDQRFSVNGQTSGAQTAQGILDKYQTPGTTASFTPGNVTDASGNTMAPGGAVTPAFDRASAETALKASHPNIFIAGSPENNAFVAHAQQHGEQSAHANVNSIMATARPATAPLNPTSENAATAIPKGGLDPYAG